MTLKSELDQFGMLFKHHLNGAVKATLVWVTAGEIDWVNKTMTAIDEDDLPYYDVLLGVGSMSVKPRKDTDCLIAKIEGDEATAFLVMADEVELIEFNGGKNGGLAVVPELKTQLEKLSKRVDGLIDAINSPKVVATPQDGGTALLGLLRVELAKITDKESFDKIEDTTIKH
ncbi:hypothetical protein [uncultured Acetobacteroides sp.]|uniref:hypothetical protein n=1 Tax=uncultured Acetobacteroides sp. TaxID=1760811 RepID=UPI0029F589B9|nr:hypothetical protein [uncultured Acetobacteroides sp.]